MKPIGYFGDFIDLLRFLNIGQHLLTLYVIYVGERLTLHM